MISTTRTGVQMQHQRSIRHAHLPACWRLSTRGRPVSLLLTLLAATALAACEGNLGDPCFDASMCSSGLECSPQNVCVRPDGSLIGEACGTVALRCADGLWCDQMYPDDRPGNTFTCTDTLPVFPSTKEFETSAESFAINEDTKILLPPSPAETDETAAELLQTVIERFGFTPSVEPYGGGPLPAGSIVLGTPSSNPGVATLVAALSIDVPAEGPDPTEDYAVRVSTDHVVVAGNGALGTLHGAQVLKQILRAYANSARPPVLEGYDVRDWPDDEQRQGVLSLNNYQDLFFPAVKDVGTDFEVETLEAYAEVFSEWRLDTMMLEVADMVAWDSLPSPHDNAATKADFLHALEAVRKHGLRFTMQMNGSSTHFGWIDVDYEPTVAHNTLHHAEYLEIYTNVIREMITSVSAVLPLDYFNIGFDEDSKRDPAETLEFIDTSFDLIVSLGTRPFMYQTWHDGTILFPHLSRDWLHLSVFDHGWGGPIDFTVLEAVLAEGYETSLQVKNNGDPEEWAQWYALDNPLQKGFLVFLKKIEGSNAEWRNFRTTCDWLRPHVEKLWNGRAYAGG